MTGLVGYGSSDEEDSVDEGRRMQLKSKVRVSQAVIKYSTYSFFTDWIDLRPHHSRNYHHQEGKAHGVSGPALQMSCSC